MKRLELIVRQRCQDDNRKIGRAFDPCEEILDPSSQLISGRRRHESGMVEASAARADHDDAVTEPSRVAELPASASDQRAL